MTDRELLAKAARSAGIEVVGYANRLLVFPEYEDSLIVRHPSGGDVEWNPLSDDGDALRLEAALLIDIRWFKNSVKASALPDSGEWLAMASEAFHENSDTSTKSAAKRRAIVRAAAAIADSTAAKE
jgi:hypothetical protein